MAEAGGITLTIGAWASAPALAHLRTRTRAGTRPCCPSAGSCSGVALDGCDRLVNGGEQVVGSELLEQRAVLEVVVDQA